MANVLPVLTSARVRLRSYQDGDADALFAMQSDPVVMRYWSYPAWTERRQAVEKLESIRAQQRDEDTFVWAIADPKNDAYIGGVTLFHLDRTHLRCELGYALAPSHQGRGLAEESVRMALSFAFDTIGLERIEADIDPRNLPSRKLVERVGFRLEGTMRARWRVNGEVCDTSFYGLLRSDFVAADLCSASTTGTPVV